MGQAGLLLFASVMLAACSAIAPERSGPAAVEDAVQDFQLSDYKAVQPVTLFDAEILPSAYPREQVERGKYLTELLACGTCHTDGALLGEPAWDRLYAGSAIGIAYSNPLEHRHPGIVYPANITPDPATGIGAWSDAELVRVIRSGVDKHGLQQRSVMPWPGYRRLHEDDALAIAAFLRSLPPVEHQVPANVRPGQQARAAFVHFGVYWRPDRSGKGHGLTRD